MTSNLYRILTFIIAVFAISNSQKGVDLYVILHYIIITISSYSLFSYANKPYSLHKVFHIFTLFFLGIAPVLQYYENVRFLGEPSIPKEVKTTVSFVIVTTMLMFNVVYAFVYRFSKVTNIENIVLRFTKLKHYKAKFKFKISIFLISLSLFSFLVILYVNGFNIMRLLFRSGDILKGGSETAKVGKSISLIANQFIRPIPFVVFVISMLYNRKSTFVNIVLFFIFVITCSPTGLARNATASYYLPLLILFIPVFKKKNVFVSVLISALLVVFPFLNNFRRFSADTKLNIGVNYDMFTELHFDAYLTFCRVVNLELITYGNQLLGVLFFFVPRSIWDGKAESSGYYHADVMGLRFKNLACTFWAEGYINFGYIGVFLFLFVLAYFCAIMDKVYWTFKNYNSFFNAIYVLILGTLLFVLRGDLMNGFAYTMGMLLSANFVYKLIVLINKLRFR